MLRDNLAIQIDENVPDMVVGDPGRLRQILLNLVNNAIKFTERGRVLVHASATPGEHDHVEVRFSVSDTGIGIHRDSMDKLFQSFSQVDTSTTRRYGGTGLGLAIAKQLSELMGGHIGVESEPGVGTTFYCQPPFQRASLAPETVAALSRYEWPGNVRQLQNVIASLAVHGPKRGRVPPSLLPAHIARSAISPAATFEAARADFERRFVLAALARAGGQRARAARALGVTRQGLAKMLRRLRIEAEVG